MYYVVHVVHQTGADLDDLLEPFSQEYEVEPTKKYISRKDFDRAVKYFAEKKEVFDSAEEMLKEWNSCDHHFDAELSNVIDDDPDTGYYHWSTSNPNGHWDWWVVGGRWSGYFAGDEEPTDTVTVSEAIELYRKWTSEEESPDLAFKEAGPYAYVTLTGDWIAREKYNPDGVGYDHDDPDSIFPNNENYMYMEYLRHIEHIPNIQITSIDIHS